MRTWKINGRWEDPTSGVIRDIGFILVTTKDVDPIAKLTDLMELDRLTYKGGKVDLITEDTAIMLTDEPWED